MEISVNERLKELIDVLKDNGIIYNQQDFSNKIGKSKTQVSGMLNGSLAVTEQTVHMIEAAFPAVNTYWLLTGEESALKSNPQITIAKTPPSVEMIPMLPIAAQGGPLNDFVTSVRREDCEKIASPIRGVDFAMSVSGDSMAPEYPSGCKILVKKIDEKAFIEWGRVYVLDTCNGSVIKKIMPGEREGQVRCVSINNDYPPFFVDLVSVYGIYRVQMMLAEK